MAAPIRFERTTFPLGGGRSIQLSYGAAVPRAAAGLSHNVRQNPSLVGHSVLNWEHGGHVVACDPGSKFFSCPQATCSVNPDREVILQVARYPRLPGNDAAARLTWAQVDPEVQSECDVGGVQARDVFAEYALQLC
jgi:hypothetical protein